MAEVSGTTSRKGDDIEAKPVGTSSREIATAAARLFAERGYDATSVREIVEAAGVTKPTLYYYFHSKEGLANALLTDPLTRLTHDLGEILETEQDPVLALERMFESHFAFCVEDPERMRFLYALFFGPLGSSLVSEVARFGREFDRLWLAACQRLAASGHIMPGREVDVTTHIRGLMVVSTVDFLYCQQEMGADRARRLVADLLHGFSPKRTISIDRSETK
jgi:AcrR family transcriptional regulator